MLDEHCFRCLVRGIADYAIYMLSLEGIVVTWNVGAERGKGYRAAEIVGRHFSCFYTEEDRACGLPARALDIARQAGRFEDEGWRVRKDGSRFWAHVVIDLIRGDDGQPIGFAKITRDRTEAARIERQLLDSERRFRHLVHSITDYAVYMLDLDGTVTNWNTGAERAKGYKAAEIVGRHFSCFYTAEDQAAGLPAEGLRIAREMGRFGAEGWRVRRDGSRLWAHVVIDLIKDDDGQAIGFAKVTRDITEQKADMERLRKVTSTLDIALANMTHGLCVFDTTEAILLANRSFREMFGYDESSDIVGIKFVDFIDHVAALGACALEIVAEEGDVSYGHHASLIGERLEAFNSLASGHARLIAMSYRTMEDGSWVSTFEDITERRRKEEEVTKLASQDPLTNLANRRVFTTQLERLLADQRQRGLSVLLIDLDGFKSVNDTYGHPAGDAVLMQAAARIRDAVRSEDIVARLGGDEFGVILLRADERYALSIAERIIASIRHPCELPEGGTARVGASVGIAVGAGVPMTADSAVSQADLALYEAKTQGKSTARVFSPALHDITRARRELETEVRTAFGTGQGIGLDYHPVVRLASGAAAGFEARLQWQHPRRGIVAPSVFIPILGYMGLMGQTGQWMLQRACGDAAVWDDELRVSVKLSALQLRTGLAPQIEEILKQSKLRPGRLDLEIDGTTLTDETFELADLSRLKDIGVQFTVAGVGSGSESIVHMLRRFPFDRIKIAAALATDARSDPGRSIMLEVVIEVGHRLGIAVIASGVDTEAQLDLVSRLGCDEATGQMIGMAMGSPAAKAVA